MTNLKDYRSGLPRCLQVWASDTAIKLPCSILMALRMKALTVQGVWFWSPCGINVNRGLFQIYSPVAHGSQCAAYPSDQAGLWFCTGI